MVLRDPKDPLNTSRGIMGPLEHSAGVQNNRGRLKQRFDLIRKLGQGTYGKVQLGIDKETGQEVAIKTIKKSKIETEADLIRIRREIQIMSSVRHPNIIHIYEVFENREKMVLVMEYAAGGELYDYLNERKILQDDEARRIFRQIASAVYYCHKNKICHRDLKLENILLDEKSNAKIADFGLSNVFDDVNMLKTFCGSPLYASPEIVKGTPYAGPEVDCWSLGVLLYTLVYGAMPFDGSNFKRLVKQISAGDYYEPKKPAEASTLIRIMLTVDPKKRAKVDDICVHPWINQGFDSNCLKSAEDLAQQTPVRLDVLLTLAPNNGINHSQPECSSKENKNQNESDSAINEPPKKQKLHGEAASSSGHKEGVPAPPKPKRKVQQVKSKSKTTPLMLDLIQDVVEEEPEDVEMQSAAAAGPPPPPPQQQSSKTTKSTPPSQKPTQQDDEDADTLSEISEIQTLAEDLDKDPSKPSKERVKSIKRKDKKAEEVKAGPSAPSAPTPVKNKTEPIPEPPKKVAPAPVVAKVVPETKPTTPTPTAPATIEPEPAKIAVVKKKVVKPKTVEAKESSSEVKTPETKKSEEAKIPKKEEAPQPAPKKESTESSKASSDEKSSDNEKSPNKKLIRQRSGSVSDVSPTRVERRNSKVISQKTAELIQNLETKTSTNGSSVKDVSESKPPPVKKLVIPAFKSVSDAKNKFETKPPRPITSSIMSLSKAAFEAKAQAASSPPIEPKPIKPVEKPKETIAPPVIAPSKAKSPSPIPPKKDEVAEKKLPVPETPQKKESPAVSPKLKPKVTKDVAKPIKAITPEPPTISEATITTAEEPTPKKQGPGKIQIPAGIQKTELKPLEIKPKLVSKVKAVEPPTPETPSTEKLLLNKLPPQNKEQAAKKITSVINKIVTSGSSSDEANKKSTPPTPIITHKTEVTFPVAAAPSMERMIPIKFEDEPETPLSAGTSNNSSRNRFPPRFDSFKKFDSASSIFSRQNSSDTESCSLAPPKHEPIRKSPREFLIPIKLEGSGHTVLPKEEVVSEGGGGGGSEDDFRMDSRLRSGRFENGSRHKRYSSLLSDSSLDEDAGASVSAGQSRRSSAATNVSTPTTPTATTGGHSRSRSQGDEPEAAATTFKRYRVKKPENLDRSDSFSSAEEDDEDFFEVFTADSLFSNLLDRVRNLTKRINKEGSLGPNWPGTMDDPSNFGLWNPSSSLRDLMARAPSETRSFSTTTPGGFTVNTHRSFSREPSVNVTLNSTASGGNWRRSLSRDVSGDSDASGSFMNPTRSYGKPLSSEVFETTSVRSLPIFNSRRSPSYFSQRSEPFDNSISSSGCSTPTPRFSHSPSRTQYGRTMSNTEYTSSPTPSRTLPFRRSLKTYDRCSSQSVGEPAADYSMESVVGAVRSLGQSLIDSPATFDPDSYLRQIRGGTEREVRGKSVGRELSISRNDNNREQSVARMTSISEQETSQTPSPSALVVGYTNGESTINEEPPKLTSLQEKMNNYHQYYQNLANPAPSPMKRFHLANNPAAANNNQQNQQPLLSPTNTAIGLARLRPNTMYETSLIDGGVQKTVRPAVAPSPKWPGVSIQQYRPLSISSFPNQDLQQRASSVARVVSPPPTQKRETTRATSVERITRFLERKSVPREVPPPVPENNDGDITPTNEQVPPITDKVTSAPPTPINKSGKPKFLQNLEKKWEKLTNGPTKEIEEKSTIKQETSHTPQRVASPPPPVHEDNSSDEINPDDNKISESVLLRRALSPEKKLKKFGSGTVNFMLGKFKRFEEVTPPQSPPANKFQLPITPTGKPPAPPGGSRIGRRVQSAYVGAASDTVLTLPQGSRPTNNLLQRGVSPIPQSRGTSPAPQPTTRPLSPPLPTPPTINERPKSPTPVGLCNGHSSEVPDNESDKIDLIRTAEAAQQKRRSLRLDIRAASPQPQPPAEKSRPLSLSISGFSDKINSTNPPTSCSSSSLIPRPNGLVTLRSSSPTPSSNTLSPQPARPPAEIITSKSMSPPQITIIENFSGTTPLSPLSPNSVSICSEDLDSCSVCSDKEYKNLSPSVLDEEESVSDRIFRKSFYSRFNSIDRAKRSSSLSAAGAARKGIHPRNPNISAGNLLTTANRPQNKSPTPTPRPPTAPKVSSPEPPPKSVKTLPPPPTDSSLSGAARAPSPHSLVINKYNPNPLFKELITDDFKSDIEKKTEYSRKVTSKLSKLLKEIESDLNTCSMTKNDDEDGMDDNDVLKLNGNHTESKASPAPQHQAPPNLGIGLKALQTGNKTVKKYSGSKTTNLVGNPVGLLGSNNFLNKRNLFNRESSLQPEDKSLSLNKRSSSVTRTMTKSPVASASGVTVNGNSDDSNSTDR